MRPLLLATLLALALALAPVPTAAADHCVPGNPCQPGVCDSLLKCVLTHVRDLVDDPCIGRPGSC